MTYLPSDVRSSNFKLQSETCTLECTTTQSEKALRCNHPQTSRAPAQRHNLTRIFYECSRYSVPPLMLDNCSRSDRALRAVENSTVVTTPRSIGKFCNCQTILLKLNVRCLFMFGSACSSQVRSVHCPLQTVDHPNL